MAKERSDRRKGIGEKRPLFKTPQEKAAFERRQREACASALDKMRPGVRDHEAGSSKKGGSR